jgi:hypothetical protein
METEKIDRKGVLLPFGFSAYTTEVKKVKVSTEKVKVYEYIPVEMNDDFANKINILV